MTNCEKAIEILHRTHDGDDLAPQHLKLVELAVNEVLTESGQVAFEQLHTQVTGRHVCGAFGITTSSISGKTTTGTCTGRGSRWITTVLTSTRMPTKLPWNWPTAAAPWRCWEFQFRRRIRPGGTTN